MMDYQSLPFIICSDFVSSNTKENYYQRNSNILTSKQIESLRRYQNADFVISGTSYLLPKAVVNSEIKQKFFYLDGFVMIEGDRKYYTKRKNLNSYLLCYTLEGEGKLEYFGKTYLLKEGQGFFIDCREYHAYYTYGNHWKITCLHFDGPLCKNYFSEFTRQKNILFSSNECPNFEMLQFEILKTAVAIMPYRDYKISCLIDFLLTELLLSESQTGNYKIQPEIIEQIILFFQEHLSEKISLSVITRKFGISTSHLEREFKKYTGFTPTAYLTRLRINYAKILLKNTRLSVEEVGIRAGIQSSANFIQIFKRYEGMTPLKYRNRGNSYEDKS